MIDALLRRASQSTAVASGWVARLRVRHWAHFLLLPLAGVPARALGESSLSLVRGAMIAALVLGFGYLLNGIADASLDRDANKNPFVGEPPEAAHGRLVVALAALAVLLALTANATVLTATLVALASGWAYSAGPRLKRFPVVGTLMNAACFAPMLFVAAPAHVAPSVLPVAAAFVALLLENQLLHEGADAPDDASGDVRSTYAWLGPVGVAVACAMLGGVVAWTVSAITSGPWRFVLPALAAVVFGVAFPVACVRTRGAPERFATLRSMHRIASAVAGAALYLGSS